MTMINKIHCLSYAAAASTAIAGVVHLMMAQNSLGNNSNSGILFLVGGILQVFWVVPMIRRWRLPWYGVGIGGTLVFIGIWVITRMPGNPITGRGGPANQNGIIVETAQIAYVILTVAIIVYGKIKSRETLAK